MLYGIKILKLISVRIQSIIYPGLERVVTGNRQKGVPWDSVNNPSLNCILICGCIYFLKFINLGKYKYIHDFCTCIYVYNSIKFYIDNKMWQVIPSKAGMIP